MALKGSAVRVRYAPGFVKQRIREPDTLFFYAQAGQNGLPPGVGTLVLQTKVIEAGSSPNIVEFDFLY